MSRYDDEFPELTDGLRRSRPQTESLPPVFNRQLRTALLQEADQMNANKNRSFNLATALGTLAAVIVLPLFFWALLNTQRPVNNPAGAAPLSEPEQTDSAAAEDHIEIAGIETEVVDGKVMAAVTVNYTLATEDAAEALIHYIIPHEGGEFRGGEALMVAQGNGTAVLDITLPPFAVDEAHELHEDVEFLVELGVTAGEIERATGMLPPDDADNYAMITTVHAARAGSEGMMEVPVEFDYELTDYPSGTVLISYELVPETAGEQVEVIEEEVDGEATIEQVKGIVTIEQGRGTGEVILQVPEDLVNEDGSLADNVALYLELAFQTAAE